MGRLFAFYRHTIGKKIVMAVTGILLLGFLVGHMVGNLKIFLGREVFNHYAYGLRHLGDPLLGYEQGLWLARVGLLAAAVLHLVSMTQLTLISRAARPIGYQQRHQLSFSPASSLMLSGGLVVFCFIVYHLLHLTLGGLHPSFSHFTGPDGRQYADAYANVVVGFQQWPVAVWYLISLALLVVHLYHGLWSACQTLGLNHPVYNHLRRPLAAAIAAVIGLGFAAVPLAVMTGLVP